MSKTRTDAKIFRVDKRAENGLRPLKTLSRAR